MQTETNKALVLLYELLFQAHAFAGGEYPQGLLPKGPIEPKESKQGLQRTEDRRFPLPGG